MGQCPRPQEEIADLSDDHNYLVHLMNDLGRVIRTRDIDHFEDSLIPFKKAMTRHNRHEEAVLQSLERRTVQAFCEYPAPKLPSVALPFTNNVS